MNIIKFNEVKERMIEIRGIPVLLDSDVAWVYGVETKEVNQAVKNNPKKFPKGYIISLKTSEFRELRSKNLTTNLVMTRVLPKAFTEKGLYMLATILKGDNAIDTTISIIEVFAQFRELQRAVAELSEMPEEHKQKTLMQKGGEILSDLLGDDLKTTDTETSFELNFSVLKFKHTVKRKKDKKE